MKYTIGFFIINLAASLCFSAPPPPVTDMLSPAEFTSEFVKTLKTKKQPIAVEIIGDLHVRVIIAAKVYNTFLDNAYKEYTAALKDLPKIMSTRQNLARDLFSRDHG
jgi:hypothetical protein